MSKAFFELLEKRFGKFAELFEPANVCRVLTSENHIQTTHLRSLLNHECAAIHVKRFYDPKTSSSLSQRLLHRDAISTQDASWEVSTGKGMESTDVKAVAGTPFTMEIDWLREAPELGIGVELLSPLDKLRLELDECHPNGATLLKDTNTGQPYLPGVGRIMSGPTRWADGFVHVDELGPLSPDAGLFSANVYLQLPPSGGELHIWGVSFKNRWDFYRHASTLSLLTTPNEEDQRRLRSYLPKPLRIRPQAGDLVLICTQRPHAVQGFPIGHRVSLQSFITHSARSPLVIDN